MEYNLQKHWIIMLHLKLTQYYKSTLLQLKKKCSHHKKTIWNFMWWWTLAKFIVIITLQISSPKTNILLYVNYISIKNKYNWRKSTHQISDSLSYPKMGKIFSKICRLHIILKLWNMKIHHKVKRQLITWKIISAHMT